ncbi:ABC transporter ATP-binding protein [Pikeienuella piscinae]|uniref:ABC transporter ATP-binding protein n=1 Tax=Pikeienuella piscinae TaxID=2748098 RepID=A0A7M3T5J9_9RHOB|nr:ABC transporter ATP-binding protein [Pikeienuella piscinae]QIE57280.1 ABC transporter ATP-binding protein [Pikeienuella piscinae]
MSLLEIRNLHIRFPSRWGDVEAVRGIDLDVRGGEIVGVVGESGAGKSTIGNAVIGLLEAPGKMTDGEVKLEGERIDKLPPQALQKIRGRKIGMIFQDPMTSLNPLFTVGQQIVETIRTHLDVSASAARKRAIQMLDEVGIADAENRIDEYPHQFSGGMRQRVVIALALCAEPDLVIADEPTTALDVSIQAQILDLIRDLCKTRNVGVVIITHDMGVIAEITDRVAVMYHGKIVEIAATKDVLGHPKEDYTKSLMAAVPRSDVKLDRFPRVSYSEDGLEKHDQVDLRSHWLGSAQKQAEEVSDPLVRCENLSMRFTSRHSMIPAWRRYFTAVDDLSFEIRRGETFGVVGESGSGKSTLARMIAGLYTPSAGRVWYNDVAVSDLQGEKELAPFRRQIQMIFQDPFSSLNPRMRLFDIIAEPIRHHRLAGSNAEIVRIVEDLLEQVELGKQAAWKYPHEFSGGQRQRISIARAFATRPRFLICDEPTSALDVSIQAQLLNLLKDLQQEMGLTMLFISHDLPVIRQMCDRVAVMQNGQLKELAETETLFESPQNPYTQHLLKLMPKLDFELTPVEASV